MEKALQNPVWHSLEETHLKWQQEINGVKFYDPTICPFGTFYEPIDVTEALVNYAQQTEKFFIVTNEEFEYDPTKIDLIKKNNGCQMVLKELIDMEITEEIIHLGEEHVDEIYDLIWKVMPGFYRKKSYEMGDYYGIFKDGKLVSISGQRMQTDSFVEISGVVTHPNYTKRGYAGQLVVHDSREIIKSGKHPILHTTVGNPAIRLYERLGFELTRQMNWWHFGRRRIDI